MAQGVRGGIGDDARSKGILLHQTIDHIGRETEFFSRREHILQSIDSPDKKGSEGVHARLDIFLQSLSGARGDEHEADLAALATDRHFACREVHILDIERAKFRKTKTGGKEEFENSFVSFPHAIGGFRRTEQPLQIFLEKNFYFSRIFLKTRHPVGREDIKLFLLDQITEECPENREMVILRPDGELCLAARAILMETLLEDPYGTFIDLHR